MHLCPEPDCLDYCTCHRDKNLDMRPAPANCQHTCGVEEDATLLTPCWPWNQPAMPGKREDAWPC